MSENTMLNTFVVYVENKPGVLTRVASLFRRRAFNIDSLTVGRTEKQEVSRMTIVVDLAPESLTIEITGGEDKIDGLLEVLRPYGVLEMVRTGIVAMRRAGKSEGANVSVAAANGAEPP